MCIFLDLLLLCKKALNRTAPPPAAPCYLLWLIAVSRPPRSSTPSGTHVLSCINHISTLYTLSLCLSPSNSISHWPGQRHPLAPVHREHVSFAPHPSISPCLSVLLQTTLPSRGNIKMAEPVEVLAAKTSSIPTSHVLEGENPLPQVVL